jgi:hypothetical protein
VEACREVIRRIRATAGDITQAWSEVEEAGREAGTTARSLQVLGEHLEEAEVLAKELETRVELALLCNTGGVTLASGHRALTYQVDTDTLTDVKAAIGARIADRILGLDIGTRLPGRDDVVRLSRVTDLMAEYSEDPQVMAGLFAGLGARGTLDVPLALRGLADSYGQWLAQMPPEGIMWDDETPMGVRIDDLNQRFMEAFGRGLGVASQSGHLEGFGTGLAGAATQGQDGRGWSLSQVLRYGTYESGFLVDVGAGLFEWEKDHRDESWWRDVDGGGVRSWRVGTADAASWDPFVGLFDASGRNPAAALGFMNPDDGGRLAMERAEYLIADRGWSADDCDALGRVLDVASTTFHTAGSPVGLQQESAWLASATIGFLAERQGDQLPWSSDRTRIGDKANDSLAHLLSVYISDVNRTASSNETTEAIGIHEVAPGATPQDPGMFAPWLVGRPWGAAFSKGSLNAVLSEVLLDGEAMTTVTNAAGDWSASAIGQGAAAWDQNAEWKSHYLGAVEQDARLMGYLLGNVEVGGEAAGRSADERGALVVDLFGSALKAIPMGGAVSTQVGREVIAQVGDEAGSAWFDAEASADERADRIQSQTLYQLKVAAARSLMGRDNLDDLVRIDPDVVNGPGGDAYLNEWLSDGSGGEVGLHLYNEIDDRFGDGRRNAGAGD